MKKFLVLVVMLFVVSGCNSLWKETADPNSTVNIIADTVKEFVDAAAKTTPAPYGWIAAIAAAVIGVYQSKRKDIVINEQDEDYMNIETATRAIIEAIEDVSNINVGEGKSVGDIVKERVTDKLKDKEAYLIGKAIISGLKNS